MFEFILGHYAYWFVFILIFIGLFAMIIKNNLIKKLIGMTIFQSAIIIFWIASSAKWHATVPVLDHAIDPAQQANYINPLPHTLMLTAIVVGVATIGVAFALLIGIQKNYHTIEEDELLEKMKP